MTPEQLNYLRGLLRANEDNLFRSFVLWPHFGDLVKDFERDVLVAWQEYLQFTKRAPQTLNNAATAYQKLVLPEFQPAPVVSRPAAHPLPMPRSSSKKITQGIQNGAPTPVRVPGVDAEPISPLPRTSAALPPLAAPVNATGTTHAVAAQPPVRPTPVVAPVAPVPAASSPAPNVPAQAPASAPAIQPAPKPASTTAQRPVLRFSVKNARQGEPFECDIAIEPSAVKPRMIGITFPDGMELVADTTNWRITGIPKLSGEFNLSVEYRYPEDSPLVIRSATLAFIVNPDPQTLWKDLPSDRSAPFWKEDTAHSVAVNADARILAARRRGRSHAHKGTCCDDDYFIEIDPTHGWFLAVVADGAGSAKFSRRGSQVATQVVASFMRNAFSTPDGQTLLEAATDYANGQQPGVPPDEKSVEGQTVRNALYVTMGHAAHAAVRALRDEVAARPDIISNIKELSTTLLIGLARKVGSRWFCAAYWVGDGAVAVYRKNQEVVLLGDPDSGEFSGQTRFLTVDEVQQDSLLRRLRFTVVDDMTGFVLMTDGVSDPKFPSEMQLGKLSEWDALWQEIDTEVHLQDAAQADARLLEWLNFWATGEYDDRTIAIIY